MQFSSSLYIHFRQSVALLRQQISLIYVGLFVNNKAL